MKRSLLGSHGERSKQRRLIESLDEDEIIIGDVQVNGEVESDWPDVSPQKLDDWTCFMQEHQLQLHSSGFWHWQHFSWLCE